MEKELEKHKVFVKELNMDMIPYSVVKKYITKMNKNAATDTFVELKETLNGLKGDLKELSELHNKLGL